MNRNLASLGEVAPFDPLKPGKVADLNLRPISGADVYIGD